MNADNLVVLNGRLTRDVDLRYATSGTAVASFTVAVNRSRTDAQGNRLADFHACVAFGKTAETINNYFHKGSMIGVVGELQDDNYEKNGVKHYSKKIIVDSFGFRESRATEVSSAAQARPSEPAQPQTSAPKTTYQQQPKTAPASNDPFASNGKPVDVSQDDLPF